MSFNRTLLLITGIVLSATPVYAASFMVDSNFDAVDAAPGDGICADASGACTVRAAIEESNALAGLDSVSVPGGTVLLASTGSSSLRVTDDLELNGAGRDVTILDGNRNGPPPQFYAGVLSVAAGAAVVVRDLTVQHGLSYGGGLENAGTLTAINVGVRGNYSPNVGGGIYNTPGARMVLQNCVVGSNAAGNVGGGMHNEGSVTIIASTFIYNSAGNSGGGLQSEGGANILSSTFVDNDAGNVGGGLAAYGFLTVANSTFSSNGAGNVGGGLHINGHLTMNNSTVTGNSAGNVGGGVAVSDEEDGSALVRNSILYGNVSRMPDCEGKVVSGGYNLFGSLTGCDLVPQPTDQLGHDPLLGPLQDNGGPTATHAITDNSPAVDAGDECEAADQRGVPRPQGPACDSGAYEVLACNFDGFVDPGEDCDDGNTVDHDGCTSLCQTEELAGAALQIAVSSRGGKLLSRAADKRVRLGWGNSSSDDPVLNGATLRVRGAGGDAFDMFYDLPAANWKYIGKRGRNRGYRYTDKTGAIRSVVVQPRKVIRVKGVNADSAMSMSTDPGPVDVVLMIGERTYSATYGGVTRFRPGRDFRARNAPPAAMTE